MCIYVHANFAAAKSYRNKIMYKYPISSEIMNDCRNGKPKAQDTIYQTYSKRMYQICKRYAQDTMEAEDILLEGFYKVFLKINTYDGKGSFEGWIRRIIINSALTTYTKNQKKIKTMPFPEIPLSQELQIQEFGSDIDYLTKAIQNLPINQKIAFNMFAIEGFSHKEIANDLKISEAQSKMYVSRARKTLQEQLKEITGLFNKSIAA